MTRVTSYGEVTHKVLEIDISGQGLRDKAMKNGRFGRLTTLPNE